MKSFWSTHIFLTLALLGFVSTNLNAQCGTDIDLNTWVEEGDTTNGNWMVTGGTGDSVSQSVNGDPTFFVSTDTLINVQINGKFYVDPATNDDDFIGFVFGYSSPFQPNTDSCNFYLFDWKANTQTFNGATGQEGFALGKVEGIFDWNTNASWFPTFWGRTPSARYTALGTDYGNNRGWQEGVEYEFSLIYTTTTITVIVENDTIFDINGCFPPGRFGFYNLSQEFSTYYDFSYQVIADISVSDQRICVGDTVDFQSVNNACLTSGFTAATITNWDWDFGDGTVSTDTNFSHVYDSSQTYTVTLIVEDDLNCIDTATVDIIVDSLPVPSLGPDTALCQATALNLNAPPGFTTYNWSNVSAGNTITINDSGTYAVTVSDANLCVGADTIFVDQYPVTAPSIGADDTICVGDSLILSTVNNYQTYLWSTGSTDSSIAALLPGDYSVTVSDTNGCTGADTMSLANYAAAITDLGPDITVCKGDTVILKPIGEFNSYLWSTGATTDSIFAFTPDTYWLRTVDSNGCVSSDTLVLDTFATVNFSIGGDTTFFCQGDTVLLDAGPGFVSYLWSDLTTNQTTSSNFSGLYWAEVVDANGCVLRDSTELSGNPKPLIAVTPDSVCPGDTGTMNTILIDTTYAVTYLWNTGDTTTSIQTAIPGTYSVTVTNSLNCFRVGLSSVNNYTPPAPNLGGNDTLCVGQSKSLNAGSGMLSYLWSTAVTQQIITVDTSGAFWVNVIDSNGCEGTDTAAVLFETGPQFSLGNDTSFCVEDTLLLNAPAGQLAYLWNTGDTTESFAVNQPGTYSVVVTGLNTCSSVDTLDATNYPVPSVDLGQDIEYCSNTTFSQPLDAGVGFSSYQWMDGSNQQVRIATEADNLIWVEVTDANTCTNRDSLNVIALNLPQVDLGTDDTLCSASNKIMNAGTGNGSIVDYLWSTGDTVQTISFTGPLNITNPVNNTFRVSVTDTNGCVNADTVLVTTVPLPNADLGGDTAFCFGDVFSKTLDPGNFNSYQWSTGDTTQTIVIGAFDSSYSVTVTDSVGCINTDNLTVAENSLPNPDLGADTAYCEGVTFAVALSPGGFQQYQWSDGSTGPILLVTQGGNYEVTVTDVNGCVNTDDLLVTELPKPTVNLGPDVTLCEDSAFSVTLDASAALPPLGYTYSWNTLESTPAILVTSFGSYSVTVEDNNNNCLDSSRVEYVPFSLVQPDLGPDTRICEGEVINLEPAVNVESGYSFTWSTGASTRSINVNEDGTYWVELNAVNGTCVGIRDTIVLSLGLLPVVELGPDINACLGQTVVLLNQETSIPDAEYKWQDTIPTTSLPVFKTGTYRVKVTNECGTVTDEVDVFFEDCYQVYVPSAFTPNEDGLNDEFYAETDQELLEYNLIVYDRWGRVVFKTNDVRARWDGTVNGEFAQEGIYVWKLMYIRAFDPNGYRVERTGHLTLSR